MPIKPGKLKIQPFYDIKGNIHTNNMMPVFYDSETGKIIDRTPEPEEKEKPFSDILKKK